MSRQRKERYEGLQKGFHLTLDGFGCQSKHLGDLDTVYQFLERTPDLIGMKKLMPPYVLRYTAPHDPDEWGVTGFVVVAQSHVAIHTYPERGYLALDIYSCEEFDLEDAILYARELFGAKEMVVNYLDRGLAVQGKEGNLPLSKVSWKFRNKSLDINPGGR